MKMTGHHSLVATVLLSFVFVAGVCADVVNPVTNLPGLAIQPSFKHYTGYVTTNATAGA